MQFHRFKYKNIMGIGSNRFIHLFFIIFLLASCASIGHSQSDTTSSESSRLGLAAEEFYYYQSPDLIEYDTLIGDVRITQDSFFLFSDLAYVRAKSFVQAFGDVVILQGDSLQIFADSLIYNNNTSEAELFGEVIFKKGNRELHTTYALYNLYSKVAQYNRGGTLFNLDQILISNSGVYDIDAGIAQFHGNVRVQDSTSLLISDSLKYDLSKEKAYLIAPSNIISDSTNVYCEAGTYDYNLNQGRFYKNLKIVSGIRTILADLVLYDGAAASYKLTGYPIIKEPNKTAIADTIIYYEDEDVIHLINQASYKDNDKAITSDIITYNLTTDVYSTQGRSRVKEAKDRILNADKMYKDELGNNIAETQVILEEQKEGIKLSADYLTSINNSDNYSAYNNEGQPLLTKILDTDTLFLKADTLKYISLDTLESYRGDNNISFIKDIISGISQQLLYVPKDTTYKFYNDPVIWSDSLQISGDSILIILDSNTINEVRIVNNAFLAIQNEYGTYQQVKGNEISVIFDTLQEIDFVNVNDNVEMVYFSYEKDILSGINHSFCGQVTFYFEEKEVSHIKFDKKPKSTYYRDKEIDSESFNLEGFLWRASEKPILNSFLK